MLNSTHRNHVAEARAFAVGGESADVISGGVREVGHLASVAANARPCVTYRIGQGRILKPAVANASLRHERTAIVGHVAFHRCRSHRNVAGCYGLHRRLVLLVGGGEVEDFGPHQVVAVVELIPVVVLGLLLKVIHLSQPLAIHVFEFRSLGILQLVVLAVDQKGFGDFVEIFELALEIRLCRANGLHLVFDGDQFHIDIVGFFAASCKGEQSRQNQ